MNRIIACVALAIASLGSFNATARVVPVEPLPGTELVGIWKASRQLTEVVQGSLVLEMGTPSRATLNRSHVTGKRDGKAIVFDFGPTAGRLRVYPAKKSVEGFWIQPANSLVSYPMATPVRFQHVGNLRWSGAVIPLQPVVTLYLVVQRGADGSLTGFIRDYQANIGIGHRFILGRAGKTVTLSDRANPDYHLAGMLDDASRVMTLSVPEYATAFRFTREPSAKRSDVYPTREIMPYAYREPVRDGDGWTVASAASVGMNQQRLAAFIQSLAVQRPSSASSPAIQAVLVARHGKLVLDEYFYGARPSDTHDIRSAGKTLTATLVGVAQRLEPTFSTRSRIGDIFANANPAAPSDERKAAITVGDLVSMTSGFQCDDEDPKAPGNEEVMMAQTAQPDWTLYALGLPMANAPGGHQAVYCSIDLHLAGAAAAKATDTWLPLLFDQHIARPLNFLAYHWGLTPTGEGYGGGGAYVRPRDLLKIGQLYLSGGTWQGKRIVSEEWVLDATRQQSVFTSGGEAPLRGSDHPDAADVHGYGYGWHLLTTTVGNRRYKEYVATGNGGQIVAVIPELDLVIGFASSNYKNGRTWWKFISSTIPEKIIPTVDGVR